MHHHLSGSIRGSTLLEFVQNNRIRDRASGADKTDKAGEARREEEEREDTQDIRDMSYFHPQPQHTPDEAHCTKSHRSLSDCFKIFDVIHRHVHSKHHVTRIVQEMLSDAHADGVTYLEIRTTPRPLRDRPAAAAADAVTQSIIVPAGMYAMPCHDMT